VLAELLPERRQRLAVATYDGRMSRAARAVGLAVVDV
jgi:hypothetical protein